MRNSKTRSPAANMELSHRSSLKTPEKSPRGVDRASEKVKVIIRIRPTLKYEEKQHLVELEDVGLFVFRTTPYGSSGPATITCI